jgi:hypothetical protein
VGIELKAKNDLLVNRGKMVFFFFFFNEEEENGSSRKA